MQVLSEKIILSSLKQGFSLSRFGDGEFKMMRAESNIEKLQTYNPILKQKLLKIFTAPLLSLLIGIPNSLCTRPYVEDFHIHFDEFILDKPAKIESVFVSSFFTRPSLVNLDSDDYFEGVKNIWKGKKIVLVNFNSDLPGHFLFCDSVCNFIEIPRRNCFDEYKKIIASCFKFCGKDKIFLISAGPVASCLAYDLCAAGEQAIDIGQIAFEYSLFQKELNSEQWTSQDSYKLKRGYLRGIND